MSEMQNHCALATEDFLCAFWWGGPGNSQRKKKRSGKLQEIWHMCSIIFSLLKVLLRRNGAQREEGQSLLFSRRLSFCSSIPSTTKTCGY